MSTIKEGININSSFEKRYKLTVENTVETIWEMSGYTGQENYWGQPPQGHYNFDSSGFGQPNQQFEFQTYNDQQSGDYSAYTQKSYLDPTQSAFTTGMYGHIKKDNCNNHREIHILHYFR